jgi:hypothetical protein
MRLRPLTLLALVACSPGYQQARQAPPSSPAITVEATPSEEPEPSPAEESPPTGDVDGDGRAETVVLQRSPANSAGEWRWGVVAGRYAYWAGYGEDNNEGQQYGPVTDLDGDGRDEVLVSPGTTATAAGWIVLTLRGDRLVPVSGPELWTGLADGAVRTVACDGGGLVVLSAVFEGTAGTRTYYRLDGTRLVRTRTERDAWGNGVPRPPAYDGYFDAC